MTEDLKPCPFCGGQAIIFKVKRYKGYATCTECQVRTITVSNDTDKELNWKQVATNLWNRRIRNETENGRRNQSLR